jgi:preprotein translocase subunit SecG
MIAFIIAIHVIACALLIVMILIQAGRGGGLVSGFSGIESMFGTKTNTFLTKSTAVLSILFFVTCLSLAVLSARQSKSIMHKASVGKTQPAAAVQPIAAAAATTAPIETEQAVAAQNTADATAKPQ